MLNKQTKVQQSIENSITKKKKAVIVRYKNAIFHIFTLPIEKRFLNDEYILGLIANAIYYTIEEFRNISINYTELREIAKDYINKGLITIETYE